MSFVSADVFNMPALTDKAMIAWLGLILVPVIMFGVITQLEAVSCQDGEWDRLTIE